MNAPARCARDLAMRHLAFAIPLTGAVLLGSACGIIPPGAQGAGGGGGGTSSSSCDGKDNCNQCVLCANDDACRSLLAACQDNSACLGLDQCLQLCSGMVQCEDDCFAGNSQGISDYVALAECVFCDTCPQDCPGQCN